MMPYTASTQVYTVDAHEPDAEVIAAAADRLRAGGLVAFPTETVYGLGANALSAEAVGHIYSAKGRPAHNPLIVHIAALDQLAQVVESIPPLAAVLAAAFWPGPLTLVLPRASRVPDVISAGRRTVAVRMPDHPVALALIRAAGVPVAAPSANRFTRPSATSAAHVLADLDGRVDVILDAGPTRIGLESTVLDLTQTPPVLLRPGGVTLEALQAHLPDILTPAASQPEPESPAAPGMLLKHYSPDAEVQVFSGPPDAVQDHMRRAALAQMAHGATVGLLALPGDTDLLADLPGLVRIDLGPDEAQAGRGLFAALRELDARGVGLILARLPDEARLGRTIADRLRRAAEGRVIVVEDK